MKLKDVLKIMLEMRVNEFIMRGDTTIGLVYRETLEYKSFFYQDLKKIESYWMSK